MVKRPNLKTPIYIDAASFSQERKSGIGHVAEQIALSLADLIENSEQDRKVYLLVPLGKSKYVKQFVNNTLKIKVILLPTRVLNYLNKLNILPPMDIFIGKGDYIFPNYRNWRLLFSRSFTYIHDLTYLNYEQYSESKNLAYLKKNVPIWVSRTDKVLTASDFTKKEIIDNLGIDADKVQVVAHGVSKEQFYKQKPQEYKSVLQSYGINSDGFILHVGNIEPRKNIIGLAQAYGGLDKDTADQHPLLLIGGDGWSNDAENKELGALLRSGRKILRPSKYVNDKDLLSFYSAASVLVMPSFYEGFGLPPLQAMACGTLVVISGNSSLKEYFGSAAITVDPFDVLDIQAGIQDALTMKKADILAYRNLAGKIVDRYSWVATATGLMDVLEKSHGDSPIKSFIKRIEIAWFRILKFDSPSYDYELPKSIKGERELHQSLIDSFFQEQPGVIRVLITKVYLFLKKCIRFGFKMIRRVVS